MVNSRYLNQSRKNLTPPPPLTLLSDLFRPSIAVYFILLNFPILSLFKTPPPMLFSYSGPKSIDSLLLYNILKM